MRRFAVMFWGDIDLYVCFLVLSLSGFGKGLLLLLKLLSHVQLFATPWTAARQTSLSLTISWIYPSSCSLHRWCSPAISYSEANFSFWPQSFPASRTFPVSQLFPSDDQNTGVSVSALVLPMSIQDWFPLGLTGLISLLSKGFSRVFFNTTVWKHQFFSAKSSLWSNSHIHA